MTDRTSQPKEYEVTDGNQIVPVASPALLLSEVLEKLAALEERDRQREEELTTLQEENRQLKDRLTDMGGRLTGFEMAQDDLEELVTGHFPSVRSHFPSKEGTKTGARTEELKEILKRRRGRATFSDLKEELKLSDSQFSKLTRRLDKRIFDIQRHPQKPKEKILILRQQIG